jgi:D-beta-D-heptose 7-phosphate kinase/D-beta-D-heptose 1-phosphate adenosyltransferase
MNDLVNTLQREKYKILLIGDACIDKYVYGTVDRISPESPVPVLKLSGKEESRPGMASNVYENLKALHCDVQQLSGPLSYKTRFIDTKSGYQLLRVDEDHKSEPIEFATFIPEMYNAIVISDYNKGCVSPETIREVRNLFRGPIFIDTKKTDLEEFDGCYVKINDLEHRSAQTLPSSRYLIVTKGSEGTLYDGKMYPTKKVEVHDVTGAGDVHLAALAVFYLFTGSIENALPFANKLASISVQHTGTYTITDEDLNSL